jgi:predicted alpha/beta hydrolase family esterase
MASRFWGCLLLAQLACAAALTVALARAFALSPLAVLLTALLACVLAPCLLVTASFVLSGTLSRALAAGPGAAREFLEALLGECGAFTWATFVTIAEPYRTQSRPPNAPPAGQGRPVLLIHGIVCNRSIWRPLIARLAARGFAPVRSINLEPLFAELDSHAATVERELRELQQQCAGAPVAIVTHSMGGLVARAALRALGPHVISRIVTIAAPHHGTRMARFIPSPPALQMSPDSAWLRTLNASQEGHLSVPVTSIYSVHDSLVAPPESSILGGARLRELRGLGHLSLLRNARALDGTLAALMEDG